MIMNRDKVLELAREAMLFPNEVPALIPAIERFAALVEREVRGDAEPVAWMYEWDGKKHLTFTDQRPIEQSHPHFNKSAPLYTHPAPAVVRQLVEALSRMTSVFLDTEGSYGSHETDAMDFAEAALAAAKDAGL